MRCSQRGCPSIVRTLDCFGLLPEAASEFLWRRSLLDDDDLERMLKPPDGLDRGQVRCDRKVRAFTSTAQFGQVLGLLDLDATRQNPSCVGTSSRALGSLTVLGAKLGVSAWDVCG